MNITVIGFDIWGYIQLIANEMCRQGHEVHYINASEYFLPHKNIAAKIKNFGSKVFLNHNLKKRYRDERIIPLIKQNQDITLVVNPGEYQKKLLQVLRTSTKKLVGWNYDSIIRQPITSFHFKLFDQLYTFDRGDASKFNNLHFLPNFIYKKKEEDTQRIYKYKAYSIIAYDVYRMKILNQIAIALNDYNILFQIKGKKIKGAHSHIKFLDKSLTLEEVEQNLKESEIMVDILRNNKYKQNGLSFRIFDALAFQQKIITTNKDIKNYDFYDPNNIFIIEKEHDIKIPTAFLEQAYKPIPNALYHKYTIENWCIIILTETTK